MHSLLNRTTGYNIIIIVSMGSFFVFQRVGPDVLLPAKFLSRLSLLNVVEVYGSSLQLVRRTALPSYTSTAIGNFDYVLLNEN